MRDTKYQFDRVVYKSKPLCQSVNYGRMANGSFKMVSKFSAQMECQSRNYVGDILDQALVMLIVETLLYILFQQYILPTVENSSKY